MFLKIKGRFRAIFLILNNIEVAVGLCLFSNVLMRNAQNAKKYSLMIVGMDENGVPHLFNQCYTDLADSIQNMVTSFLNRVVQLGFPHPIRLVVDNAHEFTATCAYVLQHFGFPSMKCPYHDFGILAKRISPRPHNHYNFRHIATNVLINSTQIKNALEAPNGLYHENLWMNNVTLRMFMLFYEIKLSTKINFR